MDRRRFVMGPGAALLLPAVLPTSAQTTETNSSAPDQSYATEMPNMLEMYLIQKQSRLAAAWEKKRALLQSTKDMESYYHKDTHFRPLRLWRGRAIA